MKEYDDKLAYDPEGPDWLEVSSLKESAAKRVRQAAMQTGDSHANIVRRLGLLGDQDVAATLATHFELPLVNEAGFTSQDLDASRFSRAFLQANQACPVMQTDAGLLVAFADYPQQELLGTLAMACGQAILPAISSLALIEQALNNLFGELSPVDDLLPAGAASTSDAEDLRDLASEAPIVRLVNDLIAQASRARASDIHIEPFRDHLQIRFRIDGVLQQVNSPPVSQAKLLVSRIKIIAGLDIAERRRPQDGRASITTDGTPLDLRIATSPSVHGESLVIRLLEDRDVEVDLRNTGLSGAHLELLTTRLSSPYGLILVVGPTGGGKTTTLAGAINELNQPGRKVISIEDPVEYQIDGVSQIAVNPAVGVTFASALRSVLRHDPDIIIVGELRDTETAEIAINAALTGHLVLATLHANTAAAAPARLVDMGVDPALLRSTLKLVIAQRLVRKLCSVCKKQPSKIQNCPHCQGTGYSGRTGLFELMDMHAGLLALIQPGAATPEMQAAADASGVHSLVDDGRAKIKAGITDRQEIERVLGLEKSLGTGTQK